MDGRGLARNPRDQLVLYELHVGTFTAEGTFAAASRRLPDLARLGITAIQLMPVADFPGRRNWGYDGVALFAPARCYGSPDDLRALVDIAHHLGMAVLLDVVYNHFGPDGSYLGRFSLYYLSQHHRTPWGPAVNLDGPRSKMVREFFIENALYWINEYHMDGLRIDATHAMVDEGPRHFLAELADRIRANEAGRPIHLIAEDHRNLAGMLKPESMGGWGLDGVWSDDFHHQIRRLLAGDDDGVYRDFRGSVADLVTTLNRGWLYQGEYSIHRGKDRGTDPSGLDPRSLVFFIQNHDRIGNRAFGERLNHQIDLASYHAATALLLCALQTPLLFMGQEWAATSPFLFFTDHDEDLGQKVREGRRREFGQYRAFQDSTILDRLADPQDETTFLASRLEWAEREREPHALTLRLYQALIALRRTEPALRTGAPGAFRAITAGEDSLVLIYQTEASLVWVAVQLRGCGVIAMDSSDQSRLPQTVGSAWEVLLSTEDPGYAPDSQAPSIDLSGWFPAIRSHRPGAVVLRARPLG